MYQKIKNDEIKYEKEIHESVYYTKLYTENSAFALNIGKPVITFIQTDSVSAIMNAVGKTTVLNFASFLYPGGGFLTGAKAQEESLCGHSFLYNVLSKCSQFYEQNKKHKNKGMYANRALYSPNVIFEDVKECDVITCASPNFSTGKFTVEENEKVLKNRIKFVCNIVRDNPTDILILGAFGCGVFKQDAKKVKQIFMENILDLPVKEIIFAIPDNKNYKKFSE